MSGTRYTQFCALARAAEIVGERWTLLIVRELLLGPTRFGDLAARLDGVSPALLTGRLNALMESGVIQRATLPAPFNAQVYELTETGRALQPAIRELIRWGGRFLFPMRDDDTFEPDWVLLALDAIARREPTPTCRIGLRVPHPGGVAAFIIEGGPEGTRVGRGSLPGAQRSRRDSTCSCKFWPDNCRSTRQLQTSRFGLKEACGRCASCNICSILRPRAAEPWPCHAPEIILQQSGDVSDRNLALGEYKLRGLALPLAGAWRKRILRAQPMLQHQPRIERAARIARPVAPLPMSSGSRL